MVVDAQSKSFGKGLLFAWRSKCKSSQRFYYSLENFDVQAMKTNQPIITKEVDNLTQAKSEWRGLNLGNNFTH